MTPIYKSYTSQNIHQQKLKLSLARERKRKKNLWIWSSRRKLVSTILPFTKSAYENLSSLIRLFPKHKNAPSRKNRFSLCISRCFEQKWSDTWWFRPGKRSYILISKFQKHKSKLWIFGYANNTRA